MDLSLNGDWIDCPTHIMTSDGLEHRNLTGLGIHRHLNGVCTEGKVWKDVSLEVLGVELIGEWSRKQSQVLQLQAISGAHLAQIR